MFVKSFEISLVLNDLIIWLTQVVDRAELLFSEVHNALYRISEKRHGVGLITESRRQISELEGMLQKEKAEFEVRD